MDEVFFLFSEFEPEIFEVRLLLGDFGGAAFLPSLEAGDGLAEGFNLVAEFPMQKTAAVDFDGFDPLVEQLVLFGTLDLAAERPHIAVDFLDDVVDAQQVLPGGFKLPDGRLEPVLVFGDRLLPRAVSAGPRLFR